MIKKILIFFFIFAIIPASQAASLTIESEDSVSYITFSSSDNTQIVAYTLQLNFSEETVIQELSSELPYMGAYNIVPEENYAKISGFTTELSPPARLARIVYSGEEPEIIVIELYDEDLNPVEVTNEKITESTPEPTPTVPVYSPDSGYVSPGVKGGVTDIPEYSSPTQYSSEIKVSKTPVPEETITPEEVPVGSSGTGQETVIQEGEDTVFSSVSEPEVTSDADDSASVPVMAGEISSPVEIPVLILAVISGMFFIRSKKKGF